MTDDKLIERLREFAKATCATVTAENGEQLTCESSIIWLAADALAAKEAALSEMRAELAEANADRCFASDDDPACKLEHKFNQIAEAERKRRLAAESELDRFRTEAAAQFKRDGEKLTEADRSAEALRKALEEAFEQCAVIAETDMRSPMAKSAGHKPEWHKHGLAIAKRIRNAAPPPRALAPSIQVEGEAR